jgi:hypothetical protein
MQLSEKHIIRYHHCWIESISNEIITSDSNTSLFNKTNHNNKISRKLTDINSM